MASYKIRTKHKIVAGVEAEMLKHVRMQNGLSRVELARGLHLAPSTASIYVDRLMQKGFLVEGDRVGRRFGRRFGRHPKLLIPNPAAGRFIGVDVEAHSLMTTVIDFSLQVVSNSQRSILKGDSADRILGRIEAAIEAAMKDDDCPLLGIGVGVPGSVDPVRGVVSYYEFVSDWINVPVVKRLSERFGVPVFLENNIRSMAMAELWLGHGKGLKNFICLGARTGIGVGVIVNGELLRGTDGAAGEIGTWPARLPTSAGDKLETLESAASLDAIIGAAEKASGRKMDFHAFKRAIEAGDRRALHVLSRAAEVHGAAIRQLDLLFNSERIIVVGPLAELGPPFIRLVTMAVGVRFDGIVPSVVNSSFGHFGGAIGAAALALHEWKPVRV